jgi:hypothetical protein
MALMALGLLENRMNKHYFFVSGMILCVVLVACQRTFPPIEDLLIDVAVFPSNWYEDPEGPKPDPSAPFGGIRSLERTTLNFESDMSGALEEIERFDGSDLASQEFSRQEVYLFQDDKGMGQYLVPKELSYQSKTANRFHFACVRPSYYPYPYLGCLYLAQYGPYIVKFDIGWSLNDMSAKELEKVLRAIDEKMAAYTE